MCALTVVIIKFRITDRAATAHGTLCWDFPWYDITSASSILANAAMAYKDGEPMLFDAGPSRPSSAGVVLKDET